ncbi:MAG TPA: c-type cytochrome, partial [Thermoanaerobaculia bacterium]|nr:c-type cytochrome [Thermoanaerobaculia bacterium]
MTRLRLLLAVVHVAALAAAAHDRAPDPVAGRQIYVSGEGKSGHPITASVAGSSELSATLLPCLNCHGADGRGRAEGGVVPSNVTWLELTKPYRAATPNGRRRPAYNEKTLARALAEGVDSAGNPLHPAMPRYAMSQNDLADLVSYLRILGRDEVPGVTETSVRAGTIVPEGAIGDQMAAVLSAYFKDAGEIHGRRVTLDVVRLPKLDGALETNPPFAFVSGLVTGAEDRVETAVERASVPLVLPVSARSDASAGNRQRFYLSPGMEEQLHGLLRFTGNLTRVVVVARDEETAAMARRAIERLENPPQVRIVKSAAAAEPNADTAVVFLDPASKLGDLSADGKAPLLFLGGLLPEDFFKAAAAYGGRIKVALTTTPADLTEGGLAEYRAFAARHSISGTHAPSQLSAYA